MNDTVRNTIFSKMLVLAVIFVLAVPYGLIVAPPKAQAEIVNDPIHTALTAIGVPEWILEVVESTLTTVGTYLQKALDYYHYVKLYVLDPLAYIESGKASQSITGGVLAFVSGGTNGTGQSQFVQNIPGHLQGVGDNATQSFLKQFSSQSNSPYAGTIVSSLRTNYLQGSSAAGFFAANRDTLPQFSQNPTAFLNGNWSQGGVSAWFALTTQSQNNPYTLYQRSQSQLGLLINTSVSAHQAQLSYGSGFLSWCGEGTPAATTATSDPNCNVSNNYCGNAVPVGGDTAGANPGAGCTQKDGTPGIVKTPGSTITNYLDKSLGLNADKITKMGDAATQISSIIGSIMEVAQLGQEVIGGAQGGLAGVGTVDASGRSLLGIYTQATSTYMGAGQCSINKTASENTATNGSELLGRVQPYLAAQKIIYKEAVTASTSLLKLKTFCTTQAQLAQAKPASAQRDLFVAKANSIALDAQKALNNYVTPVFSLAASASSTAAAAVVYVKEVNIKLKTLPAGDPPACRDYSAEINRFSTAPPTSDDLARALTDSKPSGAATSTAPGTLVLLNDIGDVLGTSVDQMRLLTKNAGISTQACTMPVWL